VRDEVDGNALRVIRRSERDIDHSRHATGAHRLCGAGSHRECGLFRGHRLRRHRMRRQRCASCCADGCRAGADPGPHRSRSGSAGRRGGNGGAAVGRCRGNGGAALQFRWERRRRDDSPHLDLSVRLAVPLEPCDEEQNRSNNYQDGPGDGRPSISAHGLAEQASDAAESASSTHRPESVTQSATR